MTAAMHRHRFLPRLYGVLLRISRRHGLFTLARIHHAVWPGEQQVLIPGGSELRIPGNTHYFGFLTGVHERHISDLVKSVVAPGDLCIDVGANIGYFSMMMAKRVGANGRVLAFEPVPETFSCLERNVELALSRGLNILPYCLAVSDSCDVLKIQRNEHSTLHQVQRLIPDNDSATEQVNCTSLDEFLRKEASPPVKLLKIDVEGHEVPALKGSVDSLRKGLILNLVIEVTPGEDAKSVEAMLGDLKCKTRCWIDGIWREVPVGGIAVRTDVWAAF